MPNKYAVKEIQPNGFVSEAAMLRREYPEYISRVWGRPGDSLQRVFNADRLETAVSSLAGQLALVPDRGPTEVVALGVVTTLPGSKHAWTFLEIRNQLTKETATSLLHFLHHLGTGIYIDRFCTRLWNSDYARPSDLSFRFAEYTNTGTHFNEKVFEALRQTRGGKVLHLYAVWRSSSDARRSVLGGSKSVKLHSRN